jgi:SAM-dependent methyltransferase
MPDPARFPLDLTARGYAYVERPNPELVRLTRELVFGQNRTARVLDVGSGAGANARELRRLAPACRIVSIEPNARAAELARAACHEVFVGRLEEWIASEDQRTFDAVLLSDVLEHLVDPMGALDALAAVAGLAHAIWIVSVPNYGVWYNRLLTLGGRFRYQWSGLYDRTHLRFFTRQSLAELLRVAGFRLLGEGCSPSLVQAGAPLWRRWFEREVDAGQHLALTETPLYGAYHRFVEPVETAFCRLWPELLGFQVVVAARLDRGSARDRRA